MPRRASEESKGPSVRDAPFVVLCPECGAETAPLKNAPSFRSVQQELVCRNGHGSWQLRATWRSTPIDTAEAERERRASIIRDLRDADTLPLGTLSNVARQLGISRQRVHQLVHHRRNVDARSRGRLMGKKAVVQSGPFPTLCAECGGSTRKRQVFATHRAVRRTYTCRRGHGFWEASQTWRTQADARDPDASQKRAGMLRELVHWADSLPDRAVTEAARQLRWPPDQVRDHLARLRKGATTVLLRPVRAAALLGVSKRTLSRLEALGRVPLAMRVGRERRWTLEEVTAFKVILLGAAKPASRTGTQKSPVPAKDARP